MKAIAPGTAVRLVQPVIKGVIVKTAANGDNFGYMVNYEDAEGNTHERFFEADQIEVDPDAVVADASATADEASA